MWNSKRKLGVESLERRENLSHAGTAVLTGFGLKTVPETPRQTKNVTTLPAMGAVALSLLAPTGMTDVKSQIAAGMETARVHTPARPRPPRVIRMASRSGTADLTSIGAPTPTVSAMSAATPVTPAVDLLAPLISKLHKDGKQDDSIFLQQIIDFANQNNIKNINLPAGVFELKHELWFYGSGITLSGQGNATVLLVDNHHTGGKDNGRALTIMPKLNTQPLVLAQPVTATSVVFKGAVTVAAGERLYLTNGIGSALKAEQKMGGSLLQNGLFHERAFNDYIEVASASVNGDGDTVVQLTSPLKNIADYNNVAPSGAKNIVNYLHASKITTPAEGLTVKGIAVQFKDMGADTSVASFYTKDLRLEEITVLNKTNAGGFGSLFTVGSIGTVIKSIKSPVAVGINSSRYVNVSGCAVQKVEMEEAATDCVIEGNKFSNAGTFAFRTNDMSCARITFQNNSAVSGAANTGAIAISEGTNITIANNTVAPGPYSGIWLGKTRGSVVRGNSASQFANYVPFDTALTESNSWQR